MMLAPPPPAQAGAHHAQSPHQRLVRATSLYAPIVAGHGCPDSSDRLPIVVVHCLAYLSE